MNNDGFLIRIASQEREVVLTAAKVLNGQVRVIGDRVASRASPGERRLAVVTERRHSGRSILLAALLRFRVRVQLLLGGPDAAPCGAVDAVQRRHRPPAVHYELLVGAHLFRSFQIPTSCG